MGVLSSLYPTNNPQICIAGLATSSGSVVTATVANSGKWEITVFQFSGVNPTTPIAATATPVNTDTSPLTTSLASAANSYVVISASSSDQNGNFAAMTPNSGQTVVQAACSAYIQTATSATTAISYTIVGGLNGRSCLGAVALNPA
jgi:hypothetical protein